VGNLGDDAVDVGVEVEREDALAWRHDLGDAPRAERKHLVDQFALGRSYLAELLAGDDQRLELALRERRAGRRLLGHEKPRQRMKGQCDRGKRPRGQPRHRGRKAEREGLGRDVADQQHQHEHHGHRDPSPRRSEPAQEKGGREAFGENIDGFVEADDHHQRFERMPQ
jgi:hypothetical protein